ncbi:MAG: hypothetical protein ACLRVN_02920 [Butyricicoccus sp.]
MKRTREAVTVAVLAVAVVVSAITAAYALSANTTETYAYLLNTRFTLIQQEVRVGFRG